MADDENYTSRTPIKNGLLNPDGSITTFSGSEIAPSNEKGAETYEKMPVHVNKFLNPDGSIHTLDEIVGGGGDVTVVQTTGSSTAWVMSQNAVTENLDLKVDAVQGKGLSTEDYTTAEKTKLAGIDSGATKTTIEQATGTSTTSVMSQNATTNAINAKVEDSITSGHTTVAPSGNSVYNALTGKLDKTSTGDSRRVYGVDALNVQELTEVETTPTSSSTKLVTSGGIKTALDTKAPLASPSFTGIPTGITQTFTATLPYASWTGSSAPYTKAVTVSGILSTDRPSIDLDLSSATYSDVATIQSSWANVYRAVTSTDTITFYASTVPTIDIPLGIKLVR